MENGNDVTLHEALRLILDKRQSTDIEALTFFNGAYYLKRQYAIKAGELILKNYAELIRNPHAITNPFSHFDVFDFSNPEVQMAYWLDSLFHNCRGSLETLSHIINYVYDLKMAESKVSFHKMLGKSQECGVGIYPILNDIQKDAWFTIINKLRNRSYHVVLNSAYPKITYGQSNVERCIRFPINPAQGNLTHDTLESFIKAGFVFESAKMEIGEFTNFVTFRLEEYLSQVDAALIQDCIDISEGKKPRSNTQPPRLKIKWMKLRSWRNVTEMKDFPWDLTEYQ
jgi:hypothetical protein